MVEIHWGWIALGLFIAYTAGREGGWHAGAAKERARIKERWRGKLSERTGRDDDLLADVDGNWIDEEE